MTAPDTSAWDSLALGEPVVEGNRNEVWRGSINGRAVAIRRSHRSEASLDWELDLIEYLDAEGFRVPVVVEAIDGRRHVDGLVVQQWIEGRPPQSEEDWAKVAETLRRVHAISSEYQQRPGCVAVAELTSTSSSVDCEMSALPLDVAEEVRAVYAGMAEMPTSVIHGDPMAGNLRLGEDGVVGLLDFDESRVDVAWHDLSNLGCQVLDDHDHAQALQLSDAWETANAWVAEPEYALTRLSSLRERIKDSGQLR